MHIFWRIFFILPKRTTVFAPWSLRTTSKITPCPFMSPEWRTRGLFKGRVSNAIDCRRMSEEIFTCGQTWIWAWTCQRTGSSTTSRTAMASQRYVARWVPNCHCLVRHRKVETLCLGLVVFDGTGIPDEWRHNPEGAWADPRGPLHQTSWPTTKAWSVAF